MVIKRLSEESKVYLWVRHRIDSLKSILVCLYGTTGSLWNKSRNLSVVRINIHRLTYKPTTKCEWEKELREDGEKDLMIERIKINYI
jgi:hypothetical protein